jgi:protein-S-isoprenylcysteine O-methyltransferase Ste14
MTIANSFTGLFIILCWIAFLVYWFAKATAVKRNVEELNIWWWRLPPFVVFVYIVAALAIGGPLAGPITFRLWPSGAGSLTAGILADIICLLGLGIAVWARSTLGGNWNTGLTFKENHELIVRGPYSRVRHPIYTGMLLMLLSVAVWYGRVSGVAFLLACIAAYWSRAIQEEKLMMRHFGSEYPAYRKRTKKFIPFIF